MSESVKGAIVTGASSGIGLAVSRSLCRLGYEVYGIGRDFEKDEVYKVSEEMGIHFHEIVCDVLDTNKLCGKVKEISSGCGIELLINNAGVGYYGLHEELSPATIQEMVRINLEVPMILTQQLLRTLKKNSGIIINISSVTAGKSNPHGCAYGATKAGLSSFCSSLFDEARKYGLKVVTIQPDMVKTNLYRNADFCEGEERESYLLPQDVAEAVEYILSRRNGVVISEITLKPQLHRIRKKK